MASPAQTPPPKTSRARHQHSKSATPVGLDNGGKSGIRRQRNNRNNNNNERNNFVQYPQSQNGYGSSQVQPYNQPQEYYSFAQPGEDVESSGAVSEGPRPPKQRQNRPAQQQFASNGGMEHEALPQSPPSVKSPLVQGAVMTPARAQAAYAGPTFHASPAPSALPVPKFFSKSVPASGSQPSLQARLESEAVDPSPKPSPPSPPDAVIAAPPRHEDSPLDFFFNADRKEKAKRGSGLFTPESKQKPAASTTQPFPSTASKNNDASHHSRHSSTRSSKRVFMIELDGGANVAIRRSPAIAAPASRSVTAPSRIPQIRDRTKSEKDTQVLQDILSSLTKPKPQPSTPYAAPDRIPSEPNSRFHTPSPFNQPRSSTRSASGPTTPAPQTNDIANPSYYYGNRNLSPLFNAAKTDSAKRSSSLRQEVTAASPTVKQNGFPFNGPPESPLNHARRHPKENADPRSVSRQYLDSVMNSPGSSASPRPARSYGQAQGSYALDGSGDRPANQIMQPNFLHQSPMSRTAGSVPQANGMSSPNKNYAPSNTPEMQSMEDSLRRLLKLNGVDGDSAGVR
ncbi:hypothetical protein BU16DRAFT_152753 [Lophium mytilinum]|uniref:Proteophosphoglycan 5 n=1 Tax=Lophium mytilinum TaxID=390894 RepID=A0A6A6QE50_9PEZI|nr:hypothetical protein BU16DRAFT_152753 [Lophium mytilinum]